MVGEAKVQVPRVPKTPAPKRGRESTGPVLPSKVDKAATFDVIDSKIA